MIARSPSVEPGVRLAWRIQLFDGLRVEQDDRVVTRFRTHKASALLAYLAFYRSRSHPREKLMDLFWPEDDESTGRASLRTAAYHLRQQLEGPRATGMVLVANRASIGLNALAVTTDVAEFEGALQMARAAGSPSERAEPLAMAVKLYRGPLLSEFYEDWIAPEQARLAEAELDALIQLARDLRSMRELNAALEYARRAVAHDPLREEAHRELMVLYATLGEPAAARKQFRELERLLREEVDSEPSAETRALLDRLAAIEPPTAEPILPVARRPLEGSPPDEGAAPVPASLEPGAAAASAQAVLPLATDRTRREPQVPVPPTRFFGRERELEQLCGCLDVRVNGCVDVGRAVPTSVPSHTRTPTRLLR